MLPRPLPQTSFAMTFRNQMIAWLLCPCWLLLSTGHAWSQQARGGASDSKRPAARTDDQAAETAKAAIPPALPGDDSGVSAILATRPTAPIDCVKAAKILADLGRPDLGKPLLKKAIDANLPPEQLAALGEALGSPALIALAECAALQPEAKQWADAALAAVSAARSDGKRIEALIQQLQDPSPDKRYVAMVRLQETPPASIGPLTQVLADPARKKDHAIVRATLADMGRLGRDAVVCLLDQTDLPLKVQAVQTLAEMKDRTVELALLAPALSAKSEPELRDAAGAALKRRGGVPARADAFRLVNEVAGNYFNRQQVLEGESEGKAAIWRWDEAKRQAVVAQRDVEDAERALAARWTREAYLLGPEMPGVLTRYLAARLDAAQYDRGLDETLDENSAAVVEAKSFGVRVLNEVLQTALPVRNPRGEHVGAAIAAIRMLGQMGKADDLLYQGAGPAPLALAARDPDRRVRMAALEAIVPLQPTKAYPGSSAVPQALAFFAATSGRRQALVMGPVPQQSRDLAGMLASQGIEGNVATHVSESLKMAVESPDYEFALIDVAFGPLQVGTLLQQLRRDERTASLRVGLIARTGIEEDADREARSDPLCKAFSKPNEDDALRWQLEQLAALAPREFVDFETRQRQAARALDLLAELSRSEAKIYDLSRTQDAVLAALYVPTLSAKAIDVLVHLNSAQSQQALVDLASRLALPLDLRSMAAKAFRQHMQKYGILLTSDEIRRQYTRYNESEKLDGDSQHLLGLILDCIEAPTQSNNAAKATIATESNDAAKSNNAKKLRTPPRETSSPNF
jgi:hypothetical protein